MALRNTIRSILLMLLASPQLAMAISQSFNSKDCPAFDAARFWLRSLMTAECSKKFAGADRQAGEVIRDLAYSAELCHNISPMVLAHLEPGRTNSILAAHREHAEPGGLSKTFMAEFATDHRIMTSEPASMNLLKNFELTWIDCSRWP